LAPKPSENRRIVGPGHSGILKGGLTGNDDKDYFSFHFYDRNNDGVGTLGVYELNWQRGWPVVDLTKPLLNNCNSSESENDEAETDYDSESENESEDESQDESEDES